MCEGPTLTYGCVTPLPVPLLAGHLLEGSPWGLCGGGGDILAKAAGLVPSHGSSPGSWMRGWVRAGDSRGVAVPISVCCGVHSWIQGSAVASGLSLISEKPPGHLQSR